MAFWIFGSLLYHVSRFDIISCSLPFPTFQSGVITHGVSFFTVVVPSGVVVVVFSIAGGALIACVVQTLEIGTLEALATGCGVYLTSDIAVPTGLAWSNCACFELAEISAGVVGTTGISVFGCKIGTVGTGDDDDGVKAQIIAEFAFPIAFLACSIGFRTMC